MSALEIDDKPVSPHDPINRRILEVSEDRVRGFVRDPMRTIAELSGIAIPVVVERIRGMLEAGTIRRVRQTLLATNEGISRTRGRLFKYNTGARESCAIPTFHPAYLLRQPIYKRLAWRDFLAIKRALAKT